MSRDEMIEICDMLSGAYRFMDFSNEQTFGVWYELLKKYEVGEVRQAVLNYEAFSAKEPTPADLLDAVKNVRLNNRRNAPDYTDWRSIESVRCRKCNDKGYVLIKYPSDYEEMRVCDCAAARSQFSFAFTDDYERQRDAICEREKPYTDGWWKDMRYKFDIRIGQDEKEDDVRELWTRKRFREVRSVERSGLIVMNVEEIPRRK